MVGSKPPHAVLSWMSAASRVDFDGAASISAGNVGSDENSPPPPPPPPPPPSTSALVSSTNREVTTTDSKVGLFERSVSAAGAAVLSAVLVNPLDVAKTRLQAQDAGIQYSSPYQRHAMRQITSFGANRIFTDVRCSPTCARVGIFGAEAICTSDCFQYKGTLDVLCKVVRQEGLARLWRGTHAGLALAVPTVGIYLPCYDVLRNWIEGFTMQSSPNLTPYSPLVAGSLARSLACITCYPIELAKTRMQAFKEFREVKPPGVWKTLLGVLSPAESAKNIKKLQGYRILWMGVGAQLARDVPFSAICWSTLEPIRRRLLGLLSDNDNAVSVLGANFSAGFIAGSLAAAATCPLDVVKTRRQIEDPSRALKMNTRQTFIEVLRDRGVRGLFTGVGPRVGRAGPSVGIVVSFYEVVKYFLNKSHADL